MSNTPRPAAYRSERIVACAVTGVATLIGGLDLWARLSSDAADSVTTTQLVVFVAVNAVAGAVLWWHRRYPVWVFGVLLAVYVVSALTTGMIGNGGLTLPLWFSIFALTAYAPLKRALIAVAVGWVVDTSVKVYLASADGYTFSAPEIALTFLGDVGFFYIGCSVLGLGFRFQYERAREAAERARLVAGHARALHAEAVATERNRLARELHDLAAHELVDALLAVRAVQVRIADSDLAVIEEKTGRALENMRTVVRALREDDEPELERLPLADAAGRMIDALRTERGMAIDATISDAEATDDAVAQAVLSVLKETLLNAARHAPGTPVMVVLNVSEEGVRLAVTNPPAPAGSSIGESTGYGLIGAEERARLVGGTFHAEPSAAGDWVAVLRLPLTARPDRALR